MTAPDVFLLMNMAVLNVERGDMLPKGEIEEAVTPDKASVQLWRSLPSCPWMRPRVTVLGSRQYSFYIYSTSVMERFTIQTKVDFSAILTIGTT